MTHATHCLSQWCPFVTENDHMFPGIWLIDLGQWEDDADRLEGEGVNGLSWSHLQGKGIAQGGCDTKIYNTKYMYLVFICFRHKVSKAIIIS